MPISKPHSTLGADNKGSCSNLAIYLEKENKSLTSQLEYWQTKDNDDFSVGSFHGKGLVERKKNKKVNNSMIQKIKNQMQLTLGFKYD